MLALNVGRSVGLIMRKKCNQSNQQNVIADLPMLSFFQLPSDLLDRSKNISN